ncbi:MAG: peptide ABC transporter substrate-binding protein, partial [Opitutaceae bacterium]
MRASATILPLILVSLLAAALAGCGRRETPVTEGIRTRTLLVGNSAEPADLDPHLAEAYTDQILLVALHEGLTVLDERTSRPLPGVAESWETSADGLTWSFRLRAGARWSNGDALTAHDFVFSFRRLLSPALGASLSYMFWPVRGAEAFNSGKATDFATVGVSAPDDRTLRLELTHPVPHLAALAAHSSWLPVHRLTLEKFDSVTKRGGAWTRPGNHIGNGPFTLAEWRPNSRLVVARNPLHRDAAANRLERVVFLPVETAEVEELNFRAGQMHLTFALPSSKVDAYRRESPSPLRVDPLLNVTYV